MMHPEQIFPLAEMAELTNMDPVDRCEAIFQDVEDYGLVNELVVIDARLDQVRTEGSE